MTTPAPLEIYCLEGPAHGRRVADVGARYISVDQQPGMNVFRSTARQEGKSQFVEYESTDEARHTYEKQGLGGLEVSGEVLDFYVEQEFTDRGGSPFEAARLLAQERLGPLLIRIAMVQEGRSSALVDPGEWPIIQTFLHDFQALAMWHDWLIEAGEEELAYDLHHFRWYFRHALGTVITWPSTVRFDPSLLVRDGETISFRQTFEHG